MNLNNCARCGQANEPGAGFCEQCGRRLGAAPAGPAALAYAAPGPAYSAAQPPAGGVIPLDFRVRPFRHAADVLGPTFRLYREHFVPVGKNVLAAALPLTALEYAVTRVALSSAEPTLFSWLATTAANALMTGALIYAVTVLLRTGAAPPLAESYAWAARKWWKVLVCSVLANLLAGVGFLFLVVPGVYVLLVYAVALPAVVVEDLRPVAALERSARLTKGYRELLFIVMAAMWATVLTVHWLTTGFTAPQFEAGSSLFVTLVYAALQHVLYSTLTVLSLFAYLGIRADRGETAATAAAAATGP